ncbi:MAG: ribonuclease R [Lachnospiraceae bacterium]|nr:ribonuclease R [Lachnospiraceae bacterium]
MSKKKAEEKKKKEEKKKVKKQTEGSEKKAGNKKTSGKKAEGKKASGKKKSGKKERRSADSINTKIKDKKKLKKEKRLITGTFISNARGFGFVTPDGEEKTEDIFIPEEYTNHAFHKDKVEVVLLKNSLGRRQEGQIVKVLEHEITTVVGTFQKTGSYGFVLSDNRKISKDLFIAKEHTMGAENGQKVVAKIKNYGSSHTSPEGQIVEILGNAGDVGVDVLSIARSYDIPMEFPEKVQAQADRCPDHVLEGDLAGRTDLRGVQMVTIDGEDAKDLDDAVSLTRVGDRYHLGVHIADVSNYVQGGSALDKEAIKRGTSVYLVDRVVPMLPKRLSNGICSLNEGEDRLALSCLMTFDLTGEIIDHTICESVIHVDRRMTYTAVNAILQDPSCETAEQYRELVPMFLEMGKLSKIIRENRSDRGAIDFSFPEAKILLDDKGKPVDIVPHEANDATRLIEDFMLSANETVAKEYCKRKLPFLYRIHETPDMDRMESTLSVIRSMGVKVEKGRKEITPKEIQRIQEKIAGTKEEPMISRLLLRSMKQAKYNPECVGHFGLAAKYYCHFTSPIRRYPDLQIHRIIKDDLRGRLKDAKIAKYSSILEGVGEKTSMLERRAVEIERETDKLKMAEYMQQHIGEVFEGVISGVTGWGFYVELPNTIEGLVHVSNMYVEYYIYDEQHFCLIGEISGKRYTLGDPVKVRVAGADLIAKTIDFYTVD